MATETRTTDKKARVTLPRAFANSTVIVEQVSDTEVRIRKARVIPEDEVRFAEEMRTPLTPRDYDLLVDLIDNPPEPTEALRRAVAKYAKRDQSLADRTAGQDPPAG
jgi:Protein of unknown function (DUF1778)